jgi:hypothetical protein
LKNNSYIKEECSMSSRNNRVLVPQARYGLDKFKLEIASELGIPNYDSIDKGELTSRQNGYVGGIMVKRMVEDYESRLSK